jgi:hypothetical protein
MAQTPKEASQRMAKSTAERVYQDFELRIGMVGPDGQYTVEFLKPVQVSHQMPMPLAPDDVRQLLQRCENGLADEEGMQVFGARLRESAFTPDMLLRMGAALGNADQGLRLRLWIQPAELAELPWEFLHGLGSSDFAVLSKRLTLSRYLPLDEPAEPLQIEGPLKVVVITASPSDLPPLDTARTVARVDQALKPLAGDAELSVVENATGDRLQDALAQNPHVLHFAGHGRYNAQAGQGALALLADDGTAQWIAAGRLGRLLRDSTVRLAYLDACQTGQATPATPGAAGSVGSGLSVAQALIAAGVPAVLGMRFSVPDEAAGIFARRFYQSLAQGEPVDAAMVAGRRAVALAGDEGDVTWGTPILFMRAPDGRLFNKPAPLAEAAGQGGGSGGVTVGSVSGNISDSNIQISTGNVTTNIGH